MQIARTWYLAAYSLIPDAAIIADYRRKPHAGNYGDSALNLPRAPN